jgi:hypothetical protein
MRVRIQSSPARRCRAAPRSDERLPLSGALRRHRRRRRSRGRAPQARPAGSFGGEQLIDSEVPLYEMFECRQKPDRGDGPREQDGDLDFPALASVSDQQRIGNAAAGQRDGGVGLHGRPRQVQPRQFGRTAQPTREHRQAHAGDGDAYRNCDRLPPQIRCHIAPGNLLLVLFLDGRLVRIERLRLDGSELLALQHLVNAWQLGLHGGIERVQVLVHLT